MAEKKLTVAQKRDRDMAALIAGVQKEYEDKIDNLINLHRIENAKSNEENYHLGFEQGYKAAEAVYQAQGVLDRLLKKAL
jgi:hypothetical protein